MGNFSSGAFDITSIPSERFGPKGYGLGRSQDCLCAPPPREIGDPGLQAGGRPASQRNGLARKTPTFHLPSTGAARAGFQGRGAAVSQARGRSSLPGNRPGRVRGKGKRPIPRGEEGARSPGAGQAGFEGRGSGRFPGERRGEGIYARRRGEGHVKDVGGRLGDLSGPSWTCGPVCNDFARHLFSHLETISFPSLAKPTILGS